MNIKHTIEIKNNEEVLILYLDYGNEFSIFNKNIHIIKSINDYIKYINFNGTKVILVVGSIIIGTLSLNPNIDNSTNEKPYTYISEITLNEFNDQLKTETKTTIDLEKKDVKIEKIDTASKVEAKTIKNNSSDSKKTNTTTKTTKKVISKSTQKNTNPSKNTAQKKITNKTNQQNTSTTQIKNETSNKIIVTIYRNNGKILKLELEEYLIGVVSAEMPASFNAEALKAQAVAARTYTLKSIKTGKKLTDTTSTQVYKDTNELKAMWGSSYNKYYNKVKDAVDSTKGLYLTYNNDYIDAVFHSTSNGLTEDSIYVWGYDIPYLKSVDSSWDKNVSSFSKTVTISYSEASKLLGFNIDKDTPIEILSKTTSNRVKTVKIKDKTYTGVNLRNILGLRSTDFNIELKDNNIIITTKGYGHGVGLSQYGSNEMAKLGKTYSQILKHYYTGVSIKKLN